MIRTQVVMVPIFYTHAFFLIMSHLLAPLVCQSLSYLSVKASKMNTSGPCSPWPTTGSVDIVLV